MSFIFLFEEIDAKHLELNYGDDNICTIDSAIMHITLKNERNFFYLEIGQTNINTIIGSAKLVEDSIRATKFLLE